MHGPHSQTARVKLVAVATVLAALVALPACGGSGGGSGGSGEAAPEGPHSAASYAQAVCGAVGTWLDQLTEEGSKLPSGSDTTLADAKPAVLVFLRHTADGVATMTSTVRAAGAPDIVGGEAANKQILDTFTTLEEQYRKAAELLSKADPADRKAFASTMQQIAVGVQHAADDAVQGLGSVTSADLNAAFEKAPACVSLRASPAPSG